MLRAERAPPHPCPTVRRLNDDGRPCVWADAHWSSLRASRGGSPHATPGTAPSRCTVGAHDATVCPPAKAQRDTAWCATGLLTTPPKWNRVSFTGARVRRGKRTHAQSSESQPLGVRLVWGFHFGPESRRNKHGYLDGTGSHGKDRQGARTGGAGKEH